MIELWDGYAITADEYNIVLGKPTKTMRRGVEEDATRDATCHPTLTKALEAFYNIQVRQSINNETHTLTTALIAAKQIEQRIRALIKQPDFERDLKCGG